MNFAARRRRRRCPPRAPRAGRAGARRRAARVELRRGRASAARALAGTLARARRRPRRRGDDADRQPPRVGARDGRLLSHRRRRAAVHRAAARQGPAPAPRRGARPALILADERNRAELERPRPRCPSLLRARRGAVRGRAGAARPSSATSDPCLITFTSGTAGRAEGGACTRQRYLDGQRLQAEHWLGAARGRARVVHGRERLVEVGAQRVHRALAARARAALLHDARFDPHERLELLARERVERALHGADRVPRDRQARDAARRCRDLRAMVAAGEALNPEVLRAWREATGLEIRDGYGQTETGQLTGAPLGRAGAARLDGHARCRASGWRSRTAS